MTEAPAPAWLSVAQAARKLKVSEQAIRKRIARGTIEWRRNNRGAQMVLVENGGLREATEAAPDDNSVPTQPESQPSTQVATSTPTDGTVVVLRGVIVILERQLADARADHGRVVAALEAEIERIDARADQERRRLMEELAQARRPWWRRLLG